MMTKYQAVLLRFVKVFIAAALGSLIITSITDAHTWTELATALAAVGFAAVKAGVAGVILAAEKFFTWQDSTPQG